MKTLFSKARKRGQAALEFLVTYGWAILVIIIVLAALWYFGIYNPQKFSSNKQAFSAEFTVLDFSGTTDGRLILQLGNNVGRKISIGTTAWVNGEPKTLVNVQFSSLELNSGDKGVYGIISAVPKGLKQGDLFAVDSVIISYKDLVTGYEHNASGFFQGKLEAGNTIVFSLDGVTVNSASPLLFISFSGQTDIYQALLNSNVTNVTNMLADVNGNGTNYSLDLAAYGIVLDEGTHTLTVDAIDRSSHQDLHAASTFYVNTNSTPTPTATPTPTPTPDVTAPIITSVLAIDTSENSTAITWSTDEQSNSTIFYDTVSSPLSNTALNSTSTTSHRIQLSGLNALTTYYYNVTSCDAADNCAESGPQNFTTNPPLLFNQTISFNVFNESDFNQGTYSNTIYNKSYLEPLDNYTKLLLHMDGANGSTIFTDDSSSSHTMATIGNTQISAAQQKFGGASGSFDGSGDYLTTAHTPDFDLGTGNWTIDLWERFNAFGSYYGLVIDAPSNIGFSIFQHLNSQLWIWNTGARYKTIPVALLTNTWYHIAVARNGNIMYIFKNGSLIDTTNVTGWNFSSPTTDLLYVGWGQPSGGYGYFKGYIDELRISKGIARWTANFTVPTEGYGQKIIETNYAQLSVGQANGAYLTQLFDATKTTRWENFSWSANSSGVTSIKFQACTTAVNSACAPSQFVGPDGTNSTYFSNSISSNLSTLAQNQYLQLKAFLGTTDAAFTPQLYNITIQATK